MRVLLTDKTYAYYGDVLHIRFIDSGNKNKSVTFTIEAAGQTWTGSTDSRGVCDTEFTVSKDVFKTSTTYVLKAVCEGIETRLNFAVSYKGYIIATVLSYLMKAFTKVGVYNEIAIVEHGFVSANFGFQNWDWQSPRTQFFCDNEPLNLYEDIYPDYNGRVYLANSIEGSDIYGNYDFKYFTDSDFSAGLHNALNRLNIAQPITSYTFDTCPREYDAILVSGAYAFLLERAIKDSSLWQNAFVLKDPSVLTHFNTLLAQAKTEFTEMLKGKTRRDLVPMGISGFKLAMPFVINETNFRTYTIASLTLTSAG